MTGAGNSQEGTDTIRARITLKIPETKCLYRISKKHPALVFKNISMLPLPNDMGNTLVEVNGVELDALVKDIEAESNILDHKIVFSTEDHVLVNLRVEDPMILKLVTKHHIIIDYPIVFQDGRSRIDLVGARRDVDALLQVFDNKGIEYEINSIGGNKPRELLSGKQKEVLVTALRKGFFEVPRRISLSELAREFDVSPTALSEMIRRLSKRLAEFYIDSTLT